MVPWLNAFIARQRVTLARGIHEYEILELHYRNVRQRREPRLG